jgi:DNA replication and repair protein RecF
MNLDIIIHNWRCFIHSQFCIPMSSFILVGDNGSGKTSLLSAFYSLHTGQPWPTTKFSESLKSGDQYYGVVTGYPDWSLTGQIGPSGRLVNKFQRPSRYSSMEATQEFPRIFTYLPSDNSWLNLSRSAKLAILDGLLGLCYGDQYSTTIKYLNKYVKSKNELIKNCQIHSAIADPILTSTLSDKILEYSQIIWEYRKSFFASLQDKLPEFQSWIQNHISDIAVKHIVSDRFGYPKNIMQLDKNEKYDWNGLWKREMAIGKTMFGAQRDDFELVIKNVPIQNMFSRGEIRLMVLFIKSLAQDLFLIANPQMQSFWLLDDVMNELDDKRELILFKKVLNKCQFFIITSTRKIDLGYKNYTLENLKKT